MLEVLNEYTLTIMAGGAMAILLLVQVIVADVVGIRAGHTPGSPVQANHDDFLFRATRTIANSNESIAIFVLAILLCIFSGASPTYSGYAAMVFVVSRTLYTLCYYFNVQILRSVMFGISLLALAVLIGVGFLT